MKNIRLKTAWLRLAAVSLMIAMCLPIFNYLPVLAEETTPSEPLIAYEEGDLTLDELPTAVLPEADIPEAVGAAAAESKRHVNRLYEQETDNCSVLFQNADGTKTLYCFGAPVKYQDENGATIDKSNKIIAMKDKAKYSGYAYQNEANDILTAFPAVLNQTKGIVLAYEDSMLALSPVGTRDAAAVWNSYRDEFNDEAQAVRYDGVFGEHTYLRYTPTFTGVKEDIILSQYTGINTFSFLLKTNGLALAGGEEGNIRIIDPGTGALKGNIDPVLVYDSFVSGSSGRHYTFNNNMTFQTVAENDAYLLTITVDSAFLTSEDTVYPVYIDPTMTCSTTTDIDDVTLNSTAGSDGASNTLYIGKRETYGVSRAIVQFPSLRMLPLTSCEQIVSANFSIRDLLGEAEEHIICVYGFNPEWDEMTVNYGNINWNNISGPLLDSAAVSYGNGMQQPVAHRYEFDVTIFAQGYKNGAYQGGIILKAFDENLLRNKTFGSSERGGTVMPVLEVKYSIMKLPTAQTSGIVNGGVYKITNKLSGKVLDVQGGGTADNTPVVQYTSNDNPNQRFKLNYVSNGVYEIVPMHTTGKVLTVDPASKRMILETQNYLNRQSWYIVPLSSYYYIINKSYAWETLSVENNLNNSAPVKSSLILGGSHWYIERVQ